MIYRIGRLDFNTERVTCEISRGLNFRPDGTFLSQEFGTGSLEINAGYLLESESSCEWSVCRSVDLSVCRSVG